jgi:glycerol-3-phosphate dehydrogenase subunit C
MKKVIMAGNLSQKTGKYSSAIRIPVTTTANGHNQLLVLQQNRPDFTLLLTFQQAEACPTPHISTTANGTGFAIAHTIQDANDRFGMKAFLDWSTYRDAGMGDAYADIPKQGGDYAKAIAACINSRQCEATGKQVMCPSFRVSGDPLLSTGGRVRLLKAALNSDNSSEALSGPELARAMDLCVACKGCKRECEANVDMALIKAEYQAQRYSREPRSWRSHLLANLPETLHRVPLLADLIRWRNRLPLLAKLSTSLTGLAPEVALPQPDPVSLSELMYQRRPETPASHGKIVLWLDTFSLNFEPDIAHSAIRVLQACGYQVQIQGPAYDGEAPLCCGRTWLAQGMIGRARAEAERLIAALWPYASQGQMIVGLEASCVLGLRDDAAALGMPDEMQAKLQTVATRTLLLEEFLARSGRTGQTFPFKGKILQDEQHPNATSLVHGHCHQKATGAMKAMRRVLKMVEGHEFDVIDSGCCGMAGSFGLEREHSAMAREMAEQALLPALRAQPQTRVVANGFSCRQQIRNHSQHQPLHLAQVLALCLTQVESQPVEK